METITDTTKFDTIRETELKVDMYDHERMNGKDSDTRVNALECWKSERRYLYALVDGLTHDEIVAYGEYLKSWSGE